MEGHVGGRWWPGCAAAALQLQATATHAGERVAPRHRQRPRLPRPVAPPPDHRAAAAVLVLVVPDAATLAEDDRLRPQRGASLVGGGRVTACVLVVIVIVVVPPPPRRPYPRPEPLREAHVLRRQAPPRRERVGRRERRRDRAVRPDVDDRDGDSRSLRRRRRRRLSLADTAVGLGSDVARRRGHLGCRRGSGGGGGGGGGLGGGASHAATAALIPWRGTAPCRGRGAALAPGSLGRRRGGGQRLAGVGDAEREADGDEGRDPRGVEDRGRRDGEPAEEVALVVERGGGGRVRYRRRRHHWYRERERERAAGVSARAFMGGGGLARDRYRGRRAVGVDCPSGVRAFVRGLVLDPGKVATLEYVATCVHGLVWPIHAATARSLAACVLPYVAVWNARELRSIGPGRQCVAGRGKSPTVPTRDWSSKFQLPSSCQILEVAVIAAGTQIWAKPLTSPVRVGPNL